MRHQTKFVLILISTLLMGCDDPSTHPAEVNACVKLWVQAYRKEAGENTIVTSDLLTEWTGECKLGRKP